MIAHNSIYIDVTDIAFQRQHRLHFQECLIEELVGAGPEHGGAHFTGGWADIAGKKLFVFEIHIDWIDKILAVEKPPTATSTPDTR